MRRNSCGTRSLMSFGQPDRVSSWFVHLTASSHTSRIQPASFISRRLAAARHRSHRLASTRSVRFGVLAALPDKLGRPGLRDFFLFFAIALLTVFSDIAIVVDVRGKSTPTLTGVDDGKLDSRKHRRHM